MKRDTGETTEEKVEISHISFRVVESPAVQTEYYKSDHMFNSYQLSTITATGLIIIVGGIILFVCFIKNYKRYKTLI